MMPRNPLHSLRASINNTRSRLALIIAAATLGGCLCNCLVVRAAPPPPKSPSPVIKQKIRKQLNGAELYALHCNRCHPERYAPERTEAQWKTILLHMRTRANIPAVQAREILKFLQEDSGK